MRCADRFHQNEVRPGNRNAHERKRADNAAQRAVPRDGTRHVLDYPDAGHQPTSGDLSGRLAHPFVRVADNSDKTILTSRKQLLAAVTFRAASSKFYSR